MRLLLQYLSAWALLFQNVQGFLYTAKKSTIPPESARYHRLVIQKLQRQPLPVRHQQLPPLQARPRSPPPHLDDDDDDDKKEQQASSSDTRRGRRRKRVRKAALSLAFASSVLLHRPRQASAAPATATAEKPRTMSLRPGMTKSQAEAVEEGDIKVIEQIEEAPSVFKSSTTPSSSEKKKPSTAFDYYGDDDEEDDLLFGDDEDAGFETVASQADKAAADKLQSSTSDKFASYHQAKTKSLTIKVGLAIFVPTFGFNIVREYVRRRREEKYVEKGLEILEAQKAEYFNVTETAKDSDVEDELKGLKKNATGTDDDDDDDNDDEDDDDDDDDDDDEPEPPSRRPPRKPRGDGGGGGGGRDGRSGGDSGGEGGKPSDEDLNKLNDLFRKS